MDNIQTMKIAMTISSVVSAITTVAGGTPDTDKCFDFRAGVSLRQPLGINL